MNPPIYMYEVSQTEHAAEAGCSQVKLLVVLARVVQFGLYESRISLET